MARDFMPMSREPVKTQFTGNERGIVEELLSLSAHERSEFGPYEVPPCFVGGHFKSGQAGPGQKRPVIQ